MATRFSLFLISVGIPTRMGDSCFLFGAAMDPDPGVAARTSDPQGLHFRFCTIFDVVDVKWNNIRLEMRKFHAALGEGVLTDGPNEESANRPDARRGGSPDRRRAAAQRPHDERRIGGPRGHRRID